MAEDTIHPDDLLERNIGGYNIIQRIEESLVFLAYKDSNPNEQVALKFFYPNAYVVDHREMILARLRPLCNIRHRNIVQIYEVGDFEDAIYVAMEYVHGENLYDLMQRKPRLHWAAAAEIAREITKGLVAAHAVDVAHLSLHPDRILLGREGQIKVNFCNEGVITPSSEIVHFVPPELFLGQPLGKSSDVYSLGTIIYNIVTGKPPLAGKTPKEVAQKHRMMAPVLPSYGVADIPHSLSLILERSLNKEITRRYENCFELLAALNNFLANDIGCVYVREREIEGRKLLISYHNSHSYKLGDYKRLFKKILDTKSHKTFTQAIKKITQENQRKKAERVKDILPVPDTSTRQLQQIRRRRLYRVNRLFTRRFGNDYLKPLIACSLVFMLYLSFIVVALIR